MYIACGSITMITYHAAQLIPSLPNTKSLMAGSVKYPFKKWMKVVIHTESDGYLSAVPNSLMISGAICF